MRELFIEGGFAMWPVLLFGLVLVGASALYAARPLKVRLAFLVAMALTVAVCTLQATWVDMGAVFGALQSPDISDAMLPRIFFEGLKESTRPGALGGALLTLSGLLVAVGTLRAPARSSTNS